MSDMFRFRCDNGDVFNAPAGTSVCPTCGRPLMTEGCGVLQVYRMGSPLGVAVGMSLYIDEIPYGHLGNKETTRIVLPYGTHNLHMAHGMSRKCTDFTFTITPQSNYAYAKAHIKAGFVSNTVVIEPANPADMPQA